MAEELVNLKLLKQKVSPEVFHELCRELGLCPECFSSDLRHAKDESGEIVCRNCGLVCYTHPLATHRLPGVGARTNYSDTCKLAFGKGLGTHLTRFNLYSVLSKAPRATQNLGVRTRIVQHESYGDTGPMMRLLSYGSALCKKYGLDNKDRTSVEFADGLGKILRICVGFSLVLFGANCCKLAKACFVYLFQKRFHNGANVQQELGVSDEMLTWVDHAVRGYMLPKKIEFFRKKDDNEVVVWECPPDLPVLKLEPKKRED